MLKKIILALLKKAIKEFPEIDNYNLIGVFGGIADFRTKHFGDADLITIGGNRVHKSFLKFFTKSLNREGFTTTIFKTVKYEPKKKNERHVLIHDLHYKNIRDVLKRERKWKTVINAIKKTKVLYGNKHILKQLPRSEITEKSFFRPYYDWIEEIKNERYLEIFSSHIKGTIPKLIKRYPNLKLKDTYLKMTSLLSYKDWRIAKRKISDLLKNKVRC